MNLLKDLSKTTINNTSRSTKKDLKITRFGKMTKNLYKPFGQECTSTSETKTSYGAKVFYDHYFRNSHQGNIENR